MLGLACSPASLVWGFDRNKECVLKLSWPSTAEYRMMKLKKSLVMWTARASSPFSTIFGSYGLLSLPHIFTTLYRTNILHIFQHPLIHPRVTPYDYNPPHPNTTSIAFDLYVSDAIHSSVLGFTSHLSSSISSGLVILADPTMMRTALTPSVAETRQVWLGAAEALDP